ncbi:transposase IS116/IS110/IS902 family protein [Nitrosococcus halophilus Nc 4]|uniref:Transposase IS116/IS110/IS902 family protein n=1 Tax=Nitrosococcus halophilus (strain Nc4) TaxID=472759 RepID=D5C3X4_NITHN|nr:IS110 family transposase [Nitrosococcus halophilus]ADE15096.1 transposase IS116/IS110/IS902 family protein [Nitrosococcus halophilus Nc 4]
MTVAAQIRVSVDIGCPQHSIAIGLAGGEVLEEFDILHRPEGFKQFFERIEPHCQRHGGEVAVAMEGYNGFARPLDSLIRVRGYPLYHINNLKLARFKEIFPAAAKSDRIDARKGLELFQLRDHLAVAKDVLQEVMPTPQENDKLKRLSRRRRALVEEKTRVLSRLQSDLQAVCPGLLAITQEAENLWFLRFLTCSTELTKLSRLRPSTLMKIPGVGRQYASIIQQWQKNASFSHEVDWVGEMIIEDARRILDLRDKIKALEARCKAVMNHSTIAPLTDSIPGFALVCSSELAGEIGTIDRFASERSLALYLGMANLDHSSGKFHGSKAPKHVNKRAKGAMMTGVDRHRKCVPESQRYYEKKRAEGKSHNQAIRALGRQLCRIIFKMLKQNRAYEIRSSTDV